MTDKQKFVLAIVAIIAVAAIVISMVVAGNSDHMLEVLSGFAGVVAFLGLAWMFFHG